VAFALVVLLLAAVIGEAGADSVPPPPPTLLTSARPNGFETTPLPPIAANTAAVVLTPHRDQQRVIRTDPKYGWQFAVVCYGYFRTEHLSQPELRFRIYAQQTEDLPTAQKVCRLLLRLQELAWMKLRLQVNLQGERVLNVWLCRQGNAGGEQWRNHLYIYSIQEIQHPIDWLREVAHEFSHAIVPGITGYTAPEPWANGYVGERLFLTWLEPLVGIGQLTPEDVCGASLEDIRQFVRQRCIPLRNVWLNGGLPEHDFQRTDAVGMGTLIGLVLYVDSVYGSSMLRATFARLSEPEPKALWKAFTQAVRESERLEINVPQGGGHVWLPAASWRVQTDDPEAVLQLGKARWQARQSNWRLAETGWYRLRGKSPVQLSR
jgi:hypothetical protein